VALAAAVGAVGLLGWGRLTEPSTVALAQAVRALGPISGWRCAQDSTYTYDPRHDAADRTLLADAPEQYLWTQVPDLRIERVEADLRGGDTVVWTHVSTPDGPAAAATPRVYVLTPGRLQSIGVQRDSGWTAICSSHLGDWHIVAEHTLK
jgi:hypothetical protein